MREKLIEICCELFERENITENTRREDITEWDSMTHVMLIAEIEEKFDKKIPFDKIDKIQCVNDILDIIKE